MSALNTAKPIQGQPKKQERYASSTRWSVLTPLVMAADSLLASERANAQEAAQADASKPPASLLEYQNKTMAHAAQLKLNLTRDRPL